MWVLKKANDLWRDWKSTLCCDVCDKYQTNAERIAAIPKYVRKEDWQKFVEMCSTPDFIAGRQLGKAAWREMKNPHTSGRKGQAKVANELERITRMHVRNPSLAQADLNNDPVASVCGLDTRGRVRGLGLGVSKSAMRHYTPFKRALEQKEALHKALETKVDELSRKMKDVEHIIVSLSQSGTQGTSSQVRPPSTRQESSSNSTTAAATTQMSSTLYKLMHLTKKAHYVAYGRLMGESLEDEGCYRVIIDEIFDGEVELQDGVSQLRDKILGDFIDWPKYRTFPC